MKYIDIENKNIPIWKRRNHYKNYLIATQKFSEERAEFLSFSKFGKSKLKLNIIVLFADMQGKMANAEINLYIEDLKYNQKKQGFDCIIFIENYFSCDHEAVTRKYKLMYENVTFKTVIR